MFLFETSQNTEQLEQIILNTEKAGGFSENAINEIFRIMHTIKGSASMMSYSNISTTAHKVEDLFFFIRDNPKAEYDCDVISDLILMCMDYINREIDKIREGNESEASDCSPLVKKIEDALNTIKNKPQSAAEQSAQVLEVNTYKCVFMFEEGCEMENIRAYSIILGLNEFAIKVEYEPADIIDNDDTAKQIREHGFIVYIETDKTYDELHTILQKTTFLRDLELTLAEKRFGQ